MHQFISGTDQQFASLQEQARAVAYVNFPDQHMPPGVSPEQARVGFEVNNDDGTATVFVDSATSYTSAESLEPSVAAWIQRGEITFDSFDQCVDWIRGPLAESFEEANLTSGAEAPAVQELQGERPNSEGSPVACLTDVDAVNRHLDDRANDSGRTRIDPDTLFESLSRKVRGQDPALRRIAQIARRHWGRTRPKRPFSVFAIGPTGVGKTYSAEILSGALEEQGLSVPVERFDMSEYQERHRISTLLGAPPSYVGYEDGGQLVDALEREPQSIIIFDEIEKAHPQVLLALMNAMDAGRLSRTGTPSSSGRTVDCRQAIFFFTSNLGSEEISGATRDLDLDNYAAVDRLCQSHLRQEDIKPELIGRITAFLLYSPLSRSAQIDIATLEIARLAGEYDVQVEDVDPFVVAHLLHEQEESAEYGVRPISYAADRLLGNTFIDAADKFGRGTPLMVVCDDREKLSTVCKPISNRPTGHGVERPSTDQ